MRRAEITDLETLDIATHPLPAKGERLIRDAVTEGLALRLRASGARTWVLYAASNGTTRRCTLGDARTIPVAVARSMAHATPSIDRTTLGDRLPPTVTVADLLPDFLASGASGRWKAGTLRNMKAVSGAHIVPTLGELRVCEITREEVTRWHLDVKARSSAARMALSTLSGLMLHAEDHGLRPAGTNPCKGLRRKQRGHRTGHLPATIVRRLWATLDRLQDAMPDACDAVRLLLLTGARRSEILALEWDRIVGARAVLEDSKEGPRTIWLNAPARAILDARRARSGDAYVFPAPRSEGPIKVIDRAWRLIRDHAQLRRLRVHDLRHHFASLAVSNGIDLRVVGQLLGHREIESTLGYARLVDSALRRSATRVSRKIDRSLRGQTAATSDMRPARSSRRSEHHG